MAATVTTPAPAAPIVQGGRGHQGLPPPKGHRADDSHWQAATRVPIDADGAVAGVVRLEGGTRVNAIVYFFIERQVWTDGPWAHLQ